MENCASATTIPRCTRLNEVRYVFRGQSPDEIFRIVRLYRGLLSGQGFEPRVTARKLEATSDTRGIGRAPRSDYAYARLNH